MPTLASAKGLGAFVPLDYSTNNGGRWEHAIVLLPQTWSSMYDLIYAPQTFAEAYRQGYGSTPFHNHFSLQKKDWAFRTPITVRIEPLTVPSPTNASILSSLDPLYPGLGAIANEWAITTPTDFLAAVLAVLATYPDGETAKVDAVESPRALKKPKPVWTLTGTGAVQPMYRLQYIAEYAIRTRTLSIYYIPRATPLSQYRLSPAYSFTTTTVTPVLNTGSTFMHVDIDFGPNKTPHNQADARARLATEFIIDPGFMNGVARPTTAPAFLKATAPFLPNHPVSNLPNTTGSSQPTVQVGSRAVRVGNVDYHQPRLLLDSVWAEVPTDFETVPNEPLCCLYEGELVENPPGTWWYVTENGLVKAYETDPGPGSPTVRANDATNKPNQ